MLVTRLVLENFKNYRSLEVEFATGVNLFVGSNGSGKTAILEAINVAMGGFFGEQGAKYQRMISFNEIYTLGTKREQFASVAAFSNELKEGWKRTIRRDTKSNDTRFVKPMSDLGSAVFNGFEKADDRFIAPLIAYYSTQRLFRDASQSAKQKYDPTEGRRNGYLQCLQESAIKGTLSTWLGNAVTRRATLQIREIEANTDLILENVETSIRRVLIGFMNLENDFPLKIYQDPDFDFELFVHYDYEHNLPLSYYSDGFRNLIFLVVDLVWRASQLNPWLDYQGLADYVDGVVTIDEIDLHLHPKWQAKAIGLLQSIFPKVQFFITTHSPTVVSNFEQGTLYVIENNKVIRHEPNYFGKQVNNVLRNVLGASDRHIPTQEKLDKLFRLIDLNLRDEYTILMRELINLLGMEDIDIVKAMALIDWQKYNYANIE